MALDGPESSEQDQTARRGWREDMPLVHIVPNMVTVAALCAGLWALRAAIAGQTAEAVGLVILAACLDGLDGRLARLLHSESPIGAELDSLIDFVNFGVVPGMIIYLWAFPAGSKIGWIAVLVYIVCCVLRLARFNVGIDDPSFAPPRPDQFLGVPSPAGALLLLWPVYLGFLWPQMLPFPPLVIAGYLVLIGGLMISRVPTPSLKSLRIRAAFARFAVVGGVAFAGLLYSYPWETLSGICLIYSALVALTLLRYAGRRAAG